MTMKKTALVTGASSGIGHTVALNLFEMDYDIIAIDQQTCNFPKGITSYILDLKNDVELKNIFTNIERLDLAINCAGVACTRKPIIEFSGAELMEQSQQNFLITFNAMKFEILKMKQHGAGKIINIASNTAHFGLRDRIAYSTSKASIVNMTKVAAIESAPYNIQINSISPASIDTPLLQEKYNGKKPNYRDIYYTRDCGSTEDVFTAVRMFIENNFLTGYDLIMDGGLSELFDVSPIT